MQDGVRGIYTYRFYPQTGNYIGFDEDKVFLLGPVSGGNIRYVGRLLEFACNVKPALCAADRPLSPVQSAWESNFLYPATSSTLFVNSVDNWRTYFLVERTMSGSPALTAEHTSLNTILALRKFSDGPPPLPEFSSCSSIRIATGGASFATVFLFSMILDEQGQPIKRCQSADRVVQYIGANTYYWPLAVDGRRTPGVELTSVETVDLSELNVTSHLRSTYPDLPFTQTLRAAANSFPRGAKLVKFNGRLMSPEVTVHLSSDQLSFQVVKDASGREATTIEQLFPYQGRQVSDGSFVIVNGRRIWTYQIPWSSASPCVIEMEGKVYSCSYRASQATPVEYLRVYNPIARDAVLQTALSW